MGDGVREEGGRGGAAREVNPVISELIARTHLDIKKPHGNLRWATGVTSNQNTFLKGLDTIQIQRHEISLDDPVDMACPLVPPLGHVQQ